jgi:alpha-glucoside transport system permease protein
MTATTEVSETPVVKPGGAKEVRRAFSGRTASILIIVLTILWTIPTFGVFVTSFRPAHDVADSGWWEFFVHPNMTWDNYHTVLFVGGSGVTGGIIPYLVNSLVITIPATLISLTIAAMAAYCIAWISFKGSDVIFFVIFALQVVPLQMSLIPLQRFYNLGAHIGSVPIFPALHLGQHHPIVQIWISHTMFALPLAVFLLHNFIAQLPRDLMEAARVDGANHFRIFRTIVLPLITPALASFAIFEFLWVWNDLLVALTFGGYNVKSTPVTARLQQMIGQYGANWQLLTAGAFVAIIIPLVVFFALQRYFVRGLLAGSVKG